MTSHQLQLWLLPMHDSRRPITFKEESIAKKLSPIRANEYRISRGIIREALSDHFGVPPLDIPLNAPQGKPPLLGEGWGKINFSHCGDALLIGWSDQNVGVDIERIDRKFDAKSLLERFYSQEEKDMLEHLAKDEFRLNALKLWVSKESAIKWQKGSVAIDLSHWMITKDFTKAVHKKLEIELRIYCRIYKSWIIGVAHNSRNLNFNQSINNFKLESKT